jgi:hypothetical protein
LAGEAHVILLTYPTALFISAFALVGAYTAISLLIGVAKRLTSKIEKLGRLK